MNDQTTIEKKLKEYSTSCFLSFQKAAKRYALFHFIFATAFLFEAVTIIAFLPLLAHTFLMGFTLALVFFTLVLYFLLKLYFQGEKPTEFISIRDHYISQLKLQCSYQEGRNQDHLFIAKAALRAGDMLTDKASSFYTVPEKYSLLSSYITQLSLYFHWYDVHLMQELFLLTSLDEHLKMIKSSPTDLQVHAATANSYLLLAQHYMDPRIKNEKGNNLPYLTGISLDRMKRKFNKATECAAEEFKIVSEYAPDDIWVQKELAHCYHNLKKSEQEIAAYQTVLKGAPSDEEALYRLGVLYFQEGSTAKGLKIYEQLMTKSPSKGNQLLSHYGLNYQQNVLQTDLSFDSQ